MACRPRLFAAGLLYHMIVRGNQRQATFLTEADYRAYRDRVAKYRQKYGAVIWAYCLMPNHVHVLVETSGPPLAKFMQGVQQSYTQYFNRTHKKMGHVFQGRYTVIVCEKDRYLVALIRYIHLNSVRAKLVQRPEQYAYSGHGAYLAGQATAVLDPTPGLAVFGGRRAYRNFVHEGIDDGHQADYYTVTDQRLLGSDRFVSQMQRQHPEDTLRRPAASVVIAVKAVAARLKKADILAHPTPVRGSTAFDKLRFRAYRGGARRSPRCAVPRARPQGWTLFLQRFTFYASRFTYLQNNAGGLFQHPGR